MIWHYTGGRFRRKSHFPKIRVPIHPTYNMEQWWYYHTSHVSYYFGCNCICISETLIVFVFVFGKFKLYLWNINCICSLILGHRWSKAQTARQIQIVCTIVCPPCGNKVSNTQEVCTGRSLLCSTILHCLLHSGIGLQCPKLNNC